jgi:hypothetical protein
MGGRAGGGAAGGMGSGLRGYSGATQSLYNAIGSGNKSAIGKATEKLKNAISKMSTEQVKAFAASSSDAVFFSSKQNTPKSEYSATTYKYNKTLAKLLNAEANRRT